jgi:hypothetical protein
MIADMVVMVAGHVAIYIFAQRNHLKVISNSIRLLLALIHRTHTKDKYNIAILTTQ